MYIEAQVGPQVLQDGSAAPPRMGKTGELVATELHGKYFEQAYRGNVFHTTQAAAGVVCTTVGTTASFAIANPQGSGKNLSIIRLQAAVKAQAASPVFGYYGVWVNNNPAAAAVTGTALTTMGTPIGSNNLPVAKPFTTATLPASPTLIAVLQQKGTSVQTPSSPPPPYQLEFDGQFLLAPGAALSIQQDAADGTNATLVCAATWEEFPI